MYSDGVKRQEETLVGWISLLLILPFAALKGWVLAMMWGWFVVPLGVRDIGVWWAAGLSLLISILLYRYKDPKPPTVERLARSSVMFVLVCLTTLLFGALYRWLGGL